MKQENPFLNLLLNIVIPAVIMIQFSKPEYLGPAKGLVIALAFPFFYGLFDLYSSKKVNFISLIGIVSILLTGGLGLLEVSASWIAVKEAAVPLIIGCVVLFSEKTKLPLVKTLFYKVADKETLLGALNKRNTRKEFERCANTASRIFAFSFFVSAFLNYVLAKVLLKSPPGTTEFTAELGRMTALSFPIIALPSTIIGAVAIYYLFTSAKRLTGLSLEQLFKQT